MYQSSKDRFVGPYTNQIKPLLFLKLSICESTMNQSSMETERSQSQYNLRHSRLCKLPDELLNEVASYMPEDDRFAARLACQHLASRITIPHRISYASALATIDDVVDNGGDWSDCKAPVGFPL
jgi:hypothetical protein